MKNKLENSKIILQTPKGTHDILPSDYGIYEHIYSKAEEIASFYGFQPIQTPHLEKTDLFTTSIGSFTDIVEKEMYTLKTKGGDRLALRPEGTAAIMRAYMEHGMQNLPQPVMLWYKGSFFRHENPQKGRFREFQQFGLEIIGEPKAAAEAVIIQVISLFLKEIGLNNYTININSIGDKECRASYRKELINYYKKKINNSCQDCKRRLKENPMRILDCKEQNCAEIKEKAPQMMDFLCSACKQHFKEVLEFLEANGISYSLNPYLVRGLDYYSKTVFEIYENKNEKQQTESSETPEGKKEVGKKDFALAAGGRYDDLANLIGKKDAPAAGGAIGVDRIAQILKEKNTQDKNKKQAKIFLIHLGTAARHKSLNVVEMFRKAHIPLEQSISKDNLRGQLKLASKLNMPYVLILGQKEALENSLIIRDMESGSQETAPIEKVVAILKRKIK